MSQSKRLEKWRGTAGSEIMVAKLTKKIAVHDDDKSPDGPNTCTGGVSF